MCDVYASLGAMKESAATCFWHFVFFPPYFLFFLRDFPTWGRRNEAFVVCRTPAENVRWSSMGDSEQYFCQQLSAVGSQSPRQSWQWPQSQSVAFGESHYKIPRIAFFPLWEIKRFASSCNPHSSPSVCLCR